MTGALVYILAYPMAP